MKRIAAYGFAIVLVLSCCAAGAEKRVRTSDELARAIEGAAGDDRVIVEPGDYVLSAAVKTAPLTIEAADASRRPVIAVGDAPLVLDVGELPGEVTVRGIIFAGGGRDAGAIQTRGTRLAVEDCEFRNFSGKAVLNSGYGKDKAAHAGIRVSRCVFKANPKGAAVSSLGPAVVEDCTIENIAGGLSFDDWTGKWGHKPRRDYKVVVRRNHIYRTEGTDWKCRALVTRTTAPEVYENVIHDLSKGDCSAMTIAANGFDKEGIPTAAQVYRNLIVDRWKAADSGYIHEAIEYGEYLPSKGRIYENVFVARVGMSPSLYNKGSENEWFNNTFCGANRFFHCYGRDCRYYNNIMFGGRADGNYFARPDWEKNRENVETGTLAYSCFFKVEHVRDREFIKGEGYFEADPMFVDPENMDFHLRFDSPCINKGLGSRDGLTPTDLGAFEYPIQVTGFKVDAAGVASWEWANEFQKASKLVRIRWNATRFPETHDGAGDATVAEVPAVGLAKAATGKTTGYFAAFVLDAKDRWSGPTPDGVHRFRLLNPAEKP
jgi:hypothetical protein